MISDLFDSNENRNEIIGEWMSLSEWKLLELVITSYEQLLCMYYENENLYINLKLRNLN